MVTYEEVVDEIHNLTKDVPPRIVLDALTGCIMGTIDECADPQRALLAVIAELMNMIRFAEISAASDAKEGERAMPLQDWIADAWKEKER